jgi:sodium-dependent phosphate cotransporter
MQKGLQLAFVYTLFNTLGVLFWLPVPFLRFPKSGARALGDIVFNYRWFLYVYMISVYFAVPMLVFCLALVPYWIGLAVFGLPVLFAGFSFLIVIAMRRLCPSVLPERLKSFNWLPVWMRSLEPLDRFVRDGGPSWCCCNAKRQRRHSVILSEAFGELTSVILPHVTRRLNSIDGLVR